MKLLLPSDVVSHAPGRKNPGQGFHCKRVLGHRNNKKTKLEESHVGVRLRVSMSNCCWNLGNGSATIGSTIAWEYLNKGRVTSTCPSP